MANVEHDFGLGEIGQILVTVGDLERAVAFYRDTLGLAFLFQAPPKMAFFACGGMRLMLAEPEPETGRRASVLYFRVADIAAAHATLAGRGVAFEEEPRPVHRAADHELWLAFFRDSEDNLMALMSEVPRG